MIIQASQILTSIRNISEEYFETFKSRLGVPYPVYKNPSYKEMLKDLGSWIRFSADYQTKVVYAWNAEMELHPYFRKSAGITVPAGSEFLFWSDMILEGVAEARGGKYMMMASDALEGKIFKVVGGDPKRRPLFLKKVLDRDWSWVDRYIKVSPWLDERRRELERLEGRNK
jgi:hypothetical protein